MCGAVVTLLLESQGGELLASELWRATFWRCLPLRKDLEQCSVWDSGDLRTKFRSLEPVLGVSSRHKELPQSLAPRFKELLAQFSVAYSGSPECCVVLVEAELTTVQNFCTFVQKSSFSGNCTSSCQRPYGSLRFWNLPLRAWFCVVEDWIVSRLCPCRHLHDSKICLQFPPLRMAALCIVPSSCVQI